MDDGAFMMKECVYLSFSHVEKKNCIWILLLAIRCSDVVPLNESINVGKGRVDPALLDIIKNIELSFEFVVFANTIHTFQHENDSSSSL